MTRPAKLRDPLPEGFVEALLDPTTTGADPSVKVEHVQTHISHVFLIGDLVYKFRRDVALPFLDFSTRAERNADCARELAVNRRLAPDVYLGIAGLFEAGGRLLLGSLDSTPDADSLENAVVMRRLPAGRDALSLLRSGELDGPAIDRIAETVAAFHSKCSLGTPAPFDSHSWSNAALQPFLDTLELGRGTGTGVVPARIIDEVETLARERHHVLTSALEQRRREGRAVDGHGDLHLQHVWLEHGDPSPRIVDAIEFREDWRRIDAAAEVAFFAMDLRYRGRPDLAERFLRTYASERDDFGLYAVVDFHVAYRAAVRGAVAAVAAVDPEVSDEQRQAAAKSAHAHLELAQRSLAAPAAGGLVLLCGSVGSGKSTAAREAAEILNGVIVSSDRTRKQLAGLHPGERGGPEIYTTPWNDRVYAALLERAEPVVGSGRVAVLDATFARRTDRERARRWAEERGLDSCLVHAQCDPQLAQSRLAARQQRGDDPSDAGPERLAPSLEAFEAPTEWPARTRLDAHTDAGDDWAAPLRADLRSWRDTAELRTSPPEPTKPELDRRR